MHDFLSFATTSPEGDDTGLVGLLIYLVIGSGTLVLWLILKSNKSSSPTTKHNPYDGDTIEAGMDRVAELIREHVVQHEAALLAKFRTTRFKDAYGQWVEESWNREVDYFYERVVHPKVYEKLDVTGHANLINRYAWLADRKHIPYDKNAWGTEPGSPFAWMSCVWIKSHIEQLAEQLPSEPLADPSAAELTPSEYESYCARLLEEAGWKAIVMGGSGDQGVDILAERDGTKLVVQCKYYSQPVGNGAVQEAHAGKAVHGAEFACVVSNCDYTPGARIAATRTGVLLLHHDQLVDLARELSTD